MRLWARIGLAIVVGFLLLASLQLIKPKPEVSWKCETKGDAGSCVVENKGGASGDVDFNVVVVCHDGEHLAHVSARVDPHSHVTKIIDGFQPSVAIFSKCAGIDYRTPMVR
jgi:hypothetical protein